MYVGIGIVGNKLDYQANLDHSGRCMVVDRFDYIEKGTSAE